MSEETQDGPALAQNVTTDQERLDGLIAQMHADLAGERADVVERALRHRLADLGLQLDADRIAGVIAQIAGR